MLNNIPLFPVENVLFKIKKWLYFFIVPWWLFCASLNVVWIEDVKVILYKLAAYSPLMKHGFYFSGMSWMYGMLCESLGSTGHGQEFQNSPLCFPGSVVLNVSYCNTVTDCIHQGWAELQDILKNEQPIVCHGVS